MRNLPNWPEAQSAMAKLSTRGQLIIAQNSSHAIQIAQPNVILSAIHDVIGKVRSGS